MSVFTPDGSYTSYDTDTFVFTNFKDLFTGCSDYQDAVAKNITFDKNKYPFLKRKYWYKAFGQITNAADYIVNDGTNIATLFISQTPDGMMQLFWDALTDDEKWLRFMTNNDPSICGDHAALMPCGYLYQWKNFRCVAGISDLENKSVNTKPSFNIYKQMTQYKYTKDGQQNLIAGYRDDAPKTSLQKNGGYTYINQDVVYNNNDYWGLMQYKPIKVIFDGFANYNYTFNYAQLKNKTLTYSYYDENGVQYTDSIEITDHDKILKYYRINPGLNSVSFYYDTTPSFEITSDNNQYWYDTISIHSMQVDFSSKNSLIKIQDLSIGTDYSTESDEYKRYHNLLCTTTNITNYLSLSLSKHEGNIYDAVDTADKNILKYKDNAKILNCSWIWNSVDSFYSEVTTQSRIINTDLQTTGYGSLIFKNKIDSNAQFLLSIGNYYFYNTINNTENSLETDWYRFGYADNAFDFIFYDTQKVAEYDCHAVRYEQDQGERLNDIYGTFKVTNSTTESSTLFFSDSVALVLFTDI